MKANNQKTIKGIFSSALATGTAIEVKNILKLQKQLCTQRIQFLLSRKLP
jgi:hypothetical protein